MGGGGATTFGIYNVNILAPFGAWVALYLFILEHNKIFHVLNAEHELW